jgi:hypothetical protein
VYSRVDAIGYWAHTRPWTRYVGTIPFALLLVSHLAALLALIALSPLVVVGQHWRWLNSRRLNAAGWRRRRTLVVTATVVAACAQAALGTAGATTPWSTAVFAVIVADIVAVIVLTDHRPLP